MEIDYWFIKNDLISTHGNFNPIKEKKVKVFLLIQISYALFVFCHLLKLFTLHPVNPSSYYEVILFLRQA